ncbi:site-determining protein [Clostridium butyricum]|uniref:Site-determining protein n=1 Tax=Clostridium butyricum TaxID=1492 RepID=A0A512TST2_CLOBU|nr:MinD/ParA family protein [Clostridium butyricum]NOW23127.1 flagellar biosynthesis protein FlhG [Clostridium butyricum]GEQ23299.1 site-determining protein [Clostridium butyricum]
MLDQAEALRKLADNDGKENQKNNISKIITVTSGKGGVGKSNFVVNLAITLQRSGKKVLIFDADLGMGNDDVLMGLYPKHNIFDIIFTDLTLKDIIIEGNEGVALIPAGSGLNKVHELTENERQLFLSKLSELDEFDYILMDTGAGVSRDILAFISASEELIIITTPEPTSLTDAYSLAKAADHFKLKDNAKVIVNKAFSKEEGIETFNKFNRAVTKFLNIKIEYLGYILDDRKLVQSVRAQKPFVNLYPNCDASKNIEDIAMKILGQDSVNTGGAKKLFKKLLNLFS